MPRYPNFIGGADRSQSPIANCARVMNLFPELLARGSKNAAALYPTPGQQTLLTVTDIGTRALFTMNARTLGVIGTGVYGIDVPTRTATKYGSVTQDNNPATITMNGMTANEAFFTTGTNGYVLDLATNVLTQVLTGIATMGGMLDGYFIAFDKVLSRISISDVNDGLTWDPTLFQARSAAPDNWQAMAINAPDIFLIGEQSGDVWFNAGNFPFPFAPRPGASFKFGTPASFSVTSVGDSVMWLSRNAEGAGVVVRARGYTPVPVSTPTVEDAIAEYERTSTIRDAEAWAYQKAGHTFYVLRFPTANATWVYDLATDVWHERGTWIPALNRFDVWHPRVHTYAAGLHIVGESGTGTLSVLDETYGTEADGTAIRRMRIPPGLFHENQQIPIRRLEVFLERGLGTATGQGSDPVCLLRESADGGKTWGSERRASVGKQGEFNKKRVAFSRMGIKRDRAIEFTFTDPIPWRVIDCFFNNEGGAG